MAQSAASNSSTITLTANTETVLVTSPVVILNNPGGQGVLISGSVTCTPATSATVFTLRVRKGSGLTGTVVTPPISNGATTAYAETIPFTVIDPTPSGTLQWTITAQQTGATDNTGTVTLATVAVQPLTLLN